MTKSEDGCTFTLILERAGSRRPPRATAALEELPGYTRRKPVGVHAARRPAIAACDPRHGTEVAVVPMRTELSAPPPSDWESASWCLRPRFAHRGVEKPDPRFFEIALERSGANRDTTIHVGDIMS